MDQKEHKEETFQAVIDGTENIKPKKKKEEKKGLKYELLDLVKTFVICFVCIFLLTTFAHQAGTCGWKKHVSYA